MSDSRVRQIIYVLVALIAVAGVYWFQRGDDVAHYGNVTANEAWIITRDISDIVILDVRDEAEFSDEHIEGAINIPIGELEENLDQLYVFDPLLVYSEMAETSRAAVSVLEDNGFERIYRLEGGFEAWKEAGYPTVSG